MESIRISLDSPGNALLQIFWVHPDPTSRWAANGVQRWRSDPTGFGKLFISPLNLSSDRRGPNKRVAQQIKSYRQMQISVKSVDNFARYSTFFRQLLFVARSRLIRIMNNRRVITVRRGRLGRSKRAAGNCWPVESRRDWSAATACIRCRSTATSPTSSLSGCSLFHRTIQNHKLI